MSRARAVGRWIGRVLAVVLVLAALGAVAGGVVVAINSVDQEEAWTP